LRYLTNEGLSHAVRVRLGAADADEAAARIDVPVVGWNLVLEA
jgi:hypothetical protein